MFRIVHYQNHFFGQSGQGEHIGMEPVCRPGPFGPGSALSNVLADLGGIAATVVCGDDHMFLDREAATARVLEMLEAQRADLVIAGPAFNAGRYGLACGAVCKAAAGKLGIPAVTGMHPENPGVGIYPEGVFIVATEASIAGMRHALPAMASLVRALLLDDAGAVAAVPCVASPGQDQETVEPAPPVRDMSRARLALVTEGGLVPENNPDMLESNEASRFYRYDLGDCAALLPGAYKTVHGGVDRAVINASPERLLPLSAVKELERLGRIGSVAGYFWSTTGNGASVSLSRSIGRELAARLLDDRVDCVLLTAT